MTQALDNTNPILWFISFLNMLRVDIFDRFELPGLDVSYWDFVIGLAIAAVVITVLVNTVRIGSVNYADSHASIEREKKSEAKSQRRMAFNLQAKEDMKRNQWMVTGRK